LPRRDGGEIGHRRVRQQRQHDPGQDQKFAGGDDFGQWNAAREGVQLLTPGQQQHRDDRCPDRHPRRQGERNGAKHVGFDIEDRYDQRRMVFAVVAAVFQVLTIKDCHPEANENEACGERYKMNRIEQIEGAAADCEHREGANTAGMPGVAAREEILEGKPEKQAHTQQDRHAGQ
jgi:hypothetical protein